MSTSSQNNGRKSSNSSIVNTPSSTPLTNAANGNSQVSTQSSPPPNNNAPKYGTLVPNRIFVGGITANTTEGDLMQLFSSYGTVKAAKIIQDRAGVSKGYGFITFESEDDAKRPLKEADNIVFKERKLNIAPAIKKQPFSRAFDASSPPNVAAGNPAHFFFPPGAAMPYFQGGVAYYPQPPPAAPGDPNAQQQVYQPPTVYPTQAGPPQTATYPSMMFPAQPIYMPQQYPMPIPYDYNFYQTNGAPPSAQYIVGGQGGPGGPQCGPIAPSNSPPRPPCYSQQMPAYNPADPMFYNIPVYGPTMEGPPVYTEAFDLGNGGPYAEDTYNMGDNNITQQGIETSIPPPVSVPAVQTLTFPTHNINVPPPPIPTSIELNVPNASSRHQMDPVVAEDVSTPRNSDTPVVSILSINEQQEKDYSSMQGGRRVKIPPPNLHNNFQIQHAQHPNGYINHFSGYNGPPPTQFGMYNGYSQNGPIFPDYRRVNGFDNRINKNRRRSYDNRKSNDHSSRSSIRTDSNSSASCVDENKNEDKSHTRTSVNTPPPAPYSPMTHQFKTIANSNTRNHQNSFRYYNNNNYYKPAYLDRSKTNDLTTHNKPSNNSSSNNSTFSCPNSPQSSISQVHMSATQTFVPQARRNKRSVRRSGTGGLNEIGAGDAPLPTEVGGEVCKKLETLKL
ncbi:uncharacterized protein [Leptinotarsa decemlineata]|uniref:uncharacterized protein n=1 Tax=Leptinotarsa decemlineata TaxID=7539 RepID=UPI003D3054F2